LSCDILGCGYLIKSNTPMITMAITGYVNANAITPAVNKAASTKPGLNRNSRQIMIMIISITIP